jgi:hypothetical protein
MAEKAKPTAREQDLMKDLLQYKYNPYEFSLYNFPWGQEKTPLEMFEGPRAWQRDDMLRIADHLQLDQEKRRIGLPPTPLYLARSSGRGIGKSAGVGMISDWFMSTWWGGTEIITANTEAQLRSRTMAEVGKWVTMGLNSHWFERSAMSVRPASWFAQLLQKQLKIDTQYYYADAQTWSEENPDAFAGAHSMIGMLLIMDEASGIPDNIWSVSDGFFTDLAEMRLWICYSNPRRASGRFFDCFHTNAKFWQTQSIDSRTVEGVDQSVYNRIIEMHGEDSDEARVEVKGQFPRQGEAQFISRELVVEAQKREPVPDPDAPLIMGVDIGRGNNDYCVARFRHGKDAQGIPPTKWRAPTFMDSARKIAWLMDKYNPDAVFIDQGMGSAVVEILKSMKYKTREVAFGGPSTRAEYAYKRTDMYAYLRDWLADGGCIDKDADLYTDLTAVEYKEYGAARDKIILERKDELKKRIGRSPDDGDALVLTFAEPVARRDIRAARRNRTPVAKGLDAPVLG